MRKKTPAERKGFILVLAYTVIAVILVVAGAGMNRAFTTYNLARRQMTSVEALYLAEAGLAQAAYELSHKVANYEDVSSSFSQSMSSPSPDFSLTYSWEDLDGSDTGVTDSTGVTTYVRKYKLSATATHNLGVGVTVNQIISLNKTYTFQHAVFYEDDLEMLPGPDMTLSGRVHSNNDIYIGANNTFTIDTEYMYSAGNIYNKRKDNGTTPSGDVKIKIYGTSNYALMKEPSDSEPLDCDRSDWTDESQNRWGGTVKSSVHGVTSLAVPEVQSIQPDGYYASKAGVKVVNGTLFYNGIPLVEGTDVPSGTVTTRTFYNYREGKYVRVADIDLKKLAGYAEGDSEGSPSFPNHLPPNGLIYATRDDAASDEEPGVRLVNGSTIYRDRGLTLVSNVPVYVLGDYNNDNKKPAAIICDSLNILSNNWDDTNSSKSLDKRVASDTEVNAAFIAGIKPTPDGGGNYSGGLENYPRLLEKWSGKTLRIRGSFVELWESDVAEGNWHYGAPYYTAPKRDWDYDTDFNDTSKLPPFTPFAVETEKVVWWKS